MTISVTHKIKIPLLLFLLCIGLTSFAHSPAYAQDGGDSNDTAGNDAVYQVARELWCPLCSGVRLDACELKACEQMRQEIALRLEEGDDTEAIKEYFVDQYGPQVLGEPPREGFNWLAWITPFLALAIGAFVLLTRGRALLFSRREVPQEHTATDPNPLEAQNTYEKKLDEELNRLR